MMRHGLLLFLAFFLLYMVGADRYDLFTDDEIRYAEAGRQMLVQGDWLVPRYNGRTRYQKPILYYWTQAVSQGLFGSTPWAARLPSALAGAGVVWLTWHLGCLTAGLQVGTWAAVLLGLSAQMFLISRMALTDMVLLLFLQGSFVCFLHARLTSESGCRASWFRAMYGCMALGLLTKGPIAIILPALVLLPWLWRRGELRSTWRHGSPYCGGLILLAIAGPWYLLVTAMTGGDFLHHFLWHENWGRFTEVVNKHHQPGLFYLLLLVPLAFPWLGFLPSSLRLAWRCPAQGAMRQSLPSLWLWNVCVVLGLFTLSRTKVWTYILPLGPALALLMASWLHRLQERRQRPPTIQTGAFAVFAVVTLAVAVIVQRHDLGFIPEPFAHGPLFQALKGSCWLLTGVAWLVWIVQRRRSVSAAVSTLCGGVVLWYLSIIYLVLPHVDEVWRAPVRQVASWVRAHPEAILFTVQIHELGLNFHADQERVYHRRLGCASELRMHLCGPKPVFILISAEHADYLEGLPFQVWCRWPGVVFGGNRPPPGTRAVVSTWLAVGPF